MIKAEVDGSGLLLLAAGCSAFEVGIALGVDGVAGLSDAGPMILPTPLLDFFFFVMLLTKIGQFTNGLIFSEPRFLQAFRDRVSGKTRVALVSRLSLCNIPDISIIYPSDLFLHTPSNIVRLRYLSTSSL